MRPIRTIATVLLVAGLAVAACGRSQPDETAAPVVQPPAATSTPASKIPFPAADTTTHQPVVLADGRHPVYPKTVDPSRRTIRFDLIQLYFGDEATREAAKDHTIAPNDVYDRNVNPKLRTLPVGANAPITVITLAWHGPNYSNDSVPVSLAKLATYMPTGSVPFWITVRHGQVVKIAEQYVP